MTRYAHLAVCVASVLVVISSSGADRELARAHAQGFASPDGIRTLLNVMVPMRDGVRLAADIYLPEAPGPFPVLLSRTPYNKKSQADTAQFFAAHGYAVVVTDSRGIYGSEGKWRPYLDEGKDGYDTQQWVGQQPWSNGRIGMFGSSYPGFTQLLAAPYRSPYVKAIMPECSQSDNFGSIWYTDGLFNMALALQWGTGQEAMAAGHPKPELNWMQLMSHLPLKTALNRIGVDSGFVADTIRQDRYNEFWKSMSVRHLFGEMDVPAFHVSGWYDELVAETILKYTKMRAQSRSEHARRWQKLLIGPWGHGAGRSDPRYGDTDFGPQMTIDLAALRMRWFDYHVKGIQNGLDQESPVRIFVMGRNQWRDENEWPLARARPTRFYLHSKGGANTRIGDGVLSQEPPGQEPPDRYTYDPRYPVPTYGGHGCCAGALTFDGPLDQRSTQQRYDVLVYHTEPLTEDVEVTGPIELQLFFSTNVRDTDFFATMSDVYPDGRALLITEGALRTRYRNSLEQPEPLILQQVYKVNISIWPTSNLFRKGHRIRLHLTSSNFPRFNRNLNSGKSLGEETESDIRVAKQTIYHDSVRPSSMVLPLVP